MGFGPRGTSGQKRLGASRRRGHLNGSTVHQGPFASLSVFPPVCSPRRPFPVTALRALRRKTRLLSLARGILRSLAAAPRSPSFSLTRPFPPLSVRLQPHGSPGRRLHLSHSLRSQGLCRGCFWEALLFFLRLGGCHLALGNKFKGHFLPFHSLLKMITSWIYDSHAT